MPKEEYSDMMQDYGNKWTMQKTPTLRFNGETSNQVSSQKITMADFNWQSRQNQPELLSKNTISGKASNGLVIP